MEPVNTGYNDLDMIVETDRQLILVNAGNQRWEVWWSLVWMKEDNNENTDNDQQGNNKLAFFSSLIVKLSSILTVLTNIHHQFNPSSSWFPMHITSYIILVNRTINTSIVTRDIGCLEMWIIYLPDDRIQHITAGSIWNGWCQTLRQFSTTEYDSVVRLQDEQDCSIKYSHSGWMTTGFGTWLDPNCIWLMIHGNNSIVDGAKDTLQHDDRRHQWMSIQIRIQGHQLEVDNVTGIRIIIHSISLRMQHETFYHNVMW